MICLAGLHIDVANCFSISIIYYSGPVIARVETCNFDDPNTAWKDTIDGPDGLCPNHVVTTGGGGPAMPTMRRHHGCGTSVQCMAADAPTPANRLT